VQESETFRVRARGALACFTRPEMKAERVSYEVMTPSAARGLLEAILWKPAMRWQVRQIAVLTPIRWLNVRRNEVSGRASPRVAPYFVEDDRTQRNTRALRDVDYVIAASLGLTSRADARDNLAKYANMFRRRLERGQHFHQPCFGCREFVAAVAPAPPGYTPIEATVDLGLVFWDFDYAGRDGAARPLFFSARLEHGVMNVPPYEGVLQQNGLDMARP
jgi:CRISPR-associated protein Cas5d